METNSEDLKQYTVKGDGGTMTCQPARLTWLKEEFKAITLHAGWSVNDRRICAEDTRFCRWPGQSTDGKKHSDADAGKPAFPFEGASDVRLRLADGIVNEQVMLMMAAVMRMQLGVHGTQSRNDTLASNLNVLWQWVVKNQLSREWITELTKIAQFRQGDSPAVGILQVYWKQQRALQNLTVTSQQVHDAATKQAPPQDAATAAQMVQEVLTSPDRADDLATLLQGLYPEMPASRARKAAEDLQEEGKTTFPYPYVHENRLAIKARRLMEDIFVPENTDGGIQRARVIYVAEWFSAPELREKEAMGEFKPGFIDEVLKHEGESAWRHWSHWHVNGDYSARIVERTWDKSRHRGQYQIITAYFRASNKDGIPGVYNVVYHNAVDIPGSDLELTGDKHGRYPFHDFPREILTGRMWDSRGVSELSMTEQQALKVLHDSFIDHAQLSAVPPIKVPAGRPKLGLVIGPLVQIKEVRPGEINWMSPPAYPVTNDKAQSEINGRIDRYFGRISAANPPDLVRTYQQGLTDSFLIDLIEVVRMGLMLCQQYMDDQTIARVTGAQGLPIARTTEDIQGQFDLECSFEAGMLNLEYLKTIADLITNYILRWDTQNTVQRDRLVRWFFSGLSPTLANDMVQPVQTAQQNEVKDEEHNFALISAGVEPSMQDEGQNFALRLNTLLGIGQKNPEAFQKLTPVSQEILKARLKHLQSQVKQQQNAFIGKTGAKPALPGDLQPQMPTGLN